MAISGALGHQGGSGTTVSRALGRQVGHEMVVSEALGRQVGSGTAVLGALGRLERPQGRHGVQKRAPQSARMDAAGTKIDAKWSLDAEKNELCNAALSGISLGVFFNRFLLFLQSRQSL